MRKTKVYNPTFENYLIQIDSYPFRFKPRSVTEVPDNLVDDLLESHRAKGLFRVADHIPIDLENKMFRAQRRKGLLNYLELTLNERIRNYRREMAYIKQQGGTPEEHPEYLQALKWKDEIIQLLSLEAPIQEEKSFLDEVGGPDKVPEVAQEKSSVEAEVVQ